MPKKKQKDQVAISLTPEQSQAISAIQNVGDAAMRSAQEVILAIEQILQEDFNFSESDIKQVESRLKDMLITLAELERKGLSILSPHDMEKVSDIAKNAVLNLQREKAGIALPHGVDPKKLKA